MKQERKLAPWSSVYEHRSSKVDISTLKDFKFLAMIRESATLHPCSGSLSAVLAPLIRSTTVTERIYFADVVNTHPNMTTMMEQQHMARKNAQERKSWPLMMRRNKGLAYLRSRRTAQECPRSKSWEKRRTTRLATATKTFLALESTSLPACLSVCLFVRLSVESISAAAVRHY